jgi:hypothetical protein
VFVAIKPKLAMNEYDKEFFWTSKTFPVFKYNTLFIGDSRVFFP